ncbi:hypothetical protein F4779DRAFT_631728 [Xylariaceae sp. FL0662B]|nr:hypothetical protein F4779DRAFT_631728 [Xylariaceae sp. FL0662B]
MGRKPAPQPLSLTGDSTANYNSNPNSTGNPSAPSSTLPSPESKSTVLVPDRTGRPNPRPALGSETSLQVISPASSRSPKTPRSPFSKFNPNRNPQTQYQSQPVDAQRPLQPADDLHTSRHDRRQVLHHDSGHRPKTSAGQPSTGSRGHSGARPHRDDEKHSRSGSRFFNFGKGSRTNNQLHHNHAESMNEVMSRGTENLAMPERMSSKNSKASKSSDVSSTDLSTQKSPRPIPSRSDVSLSSSMGEYESASLNKKNKPNPFTLLGRSRSIKDEDSQSPKESTTLKVSEAERATTFSGPQPLRTAPMHPDGQERSFRHMMNSAARNQSADRALPREALANKEHRPDKDYNRSHPSLRDNGHSTFLNGLKSSGSRAADMISKGLFGKGGRSASASDYSPVVDDEHYVLKVINLPLVEQTRLTRISKRLEDSRDKTEFWMPAFPWRAIDYLNFKGTDVEGLYRVPGSGPQIKKWQRKFDEEYDVDLFAQDDLYDINIIGSMLKAWLRELPDELFPKEAQERISRECAGAEEVPQMLIDELSNLSPFNYYLLFAITCHLSLLLAHSDKNKMDFRNLCICFQPCMKIDAFCFKFLVCDWRLCWQGCKNEAKYIEDEYMVFKQPIPRGLTMETFNGSTDQSRPSSDSSRPSVSPNEPQNGKLRKKPVPAGQPNGNMTSNHSAVSTSLAVNRELDAPGRRDGELRPLSPIKPLSPMNF